MKSLKITFILLFITGVVIIVSSVFGDDRVMKVENDINNQEDLVRFLNSDLANLYSRKINSKDEIDKGNTIYKVCKKAKRLGVSLEVFPNKTKEQKDFKSYCEFVFKNS